MEPIDLAIVIVNWNVRDLLRRCLDSVYADLARSELQGAVWVIDNASHDDSVAMVRGQFPQTHLLANTENLGFARANNQALRAMGFFSDTPLTELPRHILFLNPDTEVLPHALHHLVDFLDQTPHAGVAGARLIYPDGSFQHSAFRFPDLAQAFLDFFPIHGRLLESRINGRYPRHLYEQGQPFPIDHPLGAAMLVRREAIRQTGGFDEAYHIYVEEIDWCMRLRKAGWKAYCVPQAEIVHHSGQSTRQIRPQMLEALWRSRFTLFQKHYSPLFRWAVRRIVRAGIHAERRRACTALRRGEIDQATYHALITAYTHIAQL